MLILLVSAFFSCQDEPKRNLYPNELIGSLELLTPERTGIDFSNTIQESTYFNHYYYSQMYVGSGVAIGDINNDGLPDVFFGGNQVVDRLYLNKGDFPKFSIPSRSVSNIVYDKKLRQYILGTNSAVRNSRNTSQLRSFSQLMWLAFFANRLTKEKKSSTLIIE